MKLVPAKCPNCGANLKLDDNMKKVDCKYCHSTIIVDEAIEKYKIDVSGSKVKIDKSDSLENYYKMAEIAYESNNKEEAEIYCNKIIEEDINNYKAWFLKGKTAGWQSTLGNLRIAETINCFTKAIENAPKNEIEQLKKDVAEEIKELSLAVINLASNNYAEYPDVDNATKLLGYVEQIANYSIKLIENCGISPDDYKGEVASLISDAVLTATDKIEDDYYEDTFPSKYVWKEFKERTMIAIDLLEFATKQSDDDDKTTKARYSLLITMTKNLISSSSWTYSDGRHVQEYTLSESDIEKYLKRIMEWNEKIKEIDPNYVIPDISSYRPSKTVQASQTTSQTNKNNQSGCYIATCIYGSYDCPEVWTLRRFRDYKLAKSWYGRLFIKTYYAISPTFVDTFGKTKTFRKLGKPKLDKMVNKLQKKGYNSTPYKDINWR